jgi:hypothetical protein
MAESEKKTVAFETSLEGGDTLEVGGNSMELPKKESGAAFLSVPVGPKSSRRVSVILTPEKKSMALLIKMWELAEGLSHVTNQLFPVYLVSIVGWTPLSVSYILITHRASSIVAQPFFANMVDRVKLHKWTILIVTALLKIVAGILMVVDPIFGLLILKSIIDGVRGVGSIAMNALTLGTVGKTRFHKKYAASNIIISHCGKALGTVILTFVSYAVWPNVKYTFFSVVISALLMIVCIALMPFNSADVVDHRTARGRSIQRRFSDFEPIQQLAMKALQEESDDECDERNEVETDPNEGLLEGLTGPTYTQVMSLKQMYSDPKRRRSLILLSLAFFMFHCANATTAPLLNQYMAINASDKRNGLPIACVLTLINQFTRIVVTWSLSGGRAAKTGYSKVLIIGGSALCLRLVLISILTTYYANYWALGATSILNGIGGACYGLMANLYSHLLSRRTGHFNLNMAMVSIAGELGDITGFFIGGALATLVSYSAAFYVLAVVAVFPGILAYFIVTPDLQRLD